MSYSLRESVIRTPGGKIKFRQKNDNGLPRYHIGVWLATTEQEELDRVSHVEYLLHPSFSKRQRRSANRANDFSITFWAWGAFEIVATVHFVDIATPSLELRHKLDVRLPVHDGTNYEKVQ